MLSCLIISKEEVENCNFSSVEKHFSRFSKKSDVLINKHSSIELMFHGYDNNESELYEIPEVMNWLSESIKKGIPWFYFLSLDFKASTLKLFLYSYCGIGKKELIGDRYLVSFNGEKLKSFIDINFTNMNIFMQKYGLSIELNKQISSKILEVLESGMKETDPFPKPKIN